MRLRNIDLNLLVIFDALLAERSVSDAAEKLGLTQSAVSHALQRLRGTFDDPLFVRGRSGLEPTARAARASVAIHDALEQIERTVGESARFDPATASRRFHLRISEYVSSHIVQHLCPFLQTVAPGIQLHVSHFTGSPRDAEFAGDEIHITFSPRVPGRSHCSSMRVVSEGFVAVMGRDNPAAAEPLTLERYTRLRHVKVSSTIGTHMIDEALAQLGLRRHIVFEVPNWRDVLPIVAASHLIAALPARWTTELATAGHGNGQFHIAPLPLQNIVFAIDLLWLARYDSDPGHAWLRAVIAEQLRAPTPGGAP